MVEKKATNVTLCWGATKKAAAQIITTIHNLYNNEVHSVCA